MTKEESADLGKPIKPTSFLWKRYVKFCQQQKLKILSCEQIKQVFGDSLIIRCGSGEYGTCYLVKDTDLVIKQMNRTLDDLSTVYNEVIMLQKLSGVSGVQKIVGAWPEQLALISENAGPTVLTWIESETLSETVKLKAVLQLAQAVQGIVGRGLVHNDLHTGNICMKLDGEDPKVTVIDFGLTTRVGAYMAYECVPGIGLHLAPELYRGAIQNSRTEVYAIGVLIRDLFPDSVPAILQEWVEQARHVKPMMRPSLEQLIDILSREFSN